MSELDKYRKLHNLSGVRQTPRSAGDIQSYDLKEIVAKRLSELKKDLTWKPLPELPPELFGLDAVAGKAPTKKNPVNKEDTIAMAMDLLQTTPIGAMAGIIKKKGGNWLDNSVEDALQMLGSRRFNNAAEAEPYFQGIRDYDEPFAAFTENFERDQSLNRWIDTTLQKYVKNRMGTEADEVRKLAEEGVTHTNNFDNWIADNLYEKRVNAGMPGRNIGVSEQAKTWEDMVDGFVRVDDAQSYVDYGLMDSLRTLKEPRYDPESALALGLRRAVINGELTDDAVEQSIKSLEESILKQSVDHNSYIPRLAIKDPTAKVYSTGDELGYHLGFNHLVDELQNALSPNSGLPQILRITPEGMSGLSMEEALRKVHGINQFRAAKALKANERFAKAEGIPVYKEYDDGSRWLEYKLPELDETKFKVGPKLLKNGEPYRGEDGLEFKTIYDENGKDLLHGTAYPYGNVSQEQAAWEAAKQNHGQKQLEEWLKQEGDTMGHCVGGYCDDVLGGRSRILSLRDAEGKSRATIELRNYQRTEDSWSDYYRNLPEELQLQLDDLANDHLIVRGWDLYELAEKQGMDLPKQPSAWAIEQIKGAGNKKPRKEDLPYIQDFVRNSEYPIDGDFDNTGLIDMKSYTGNFIDGLMNKEEAHKAIIDLFNDPTSSLYGKDPSLWLKGLEDY